MKKEELILEKISAIESQLESLVKPARKTQELKEDIMPLMNQGINLMINEMLEVESGFELGDLLTLVKQLMRSTNNLFYCLKTLDSMIELVKDLEPLLRSAVPQLITYLDDLEKKGVLRMLKATLDVRAKVAQTYNSDDIDVIGDGFVKMLGMAKNLTDPKTEELLEKLMDLPKNIDLKNSKPAGPGKLMTAGFDKELQAGLGVMLELTKAMGKLK